MDKIKIQTDGHPENTKIFLNDKEVFLPITDIQLRIDLNGVSANLSLSTIELDAGLDKDQISFTLSETPKPKPVGPELFFGNDKQGTPNWGGTPPKRPKNPSDFVKDA